MKTVVNLDLPIADSAFLRRIGRQLLLTVKITSARKRSRSLDIRWLHQNLRNTTRRPQTLLHRQADMQHVHRPAA